MINKEATISALVQDVRDLLDASYVGLYEFMWILRGMELDEPDSSLRKLAREALDRLVTTEKQLRGVLLEWPPIEPVGEFSLDDIPDDAWDEPSDDRPYPALDRP